MERSMSFRERRATVAKSDAYELAAQLAAAVRRYAQARERSRKARNECHALEAEQQAPPELVKQARARYEAAEAKCMQLKHVIDALEERLG